MKRSKHSLSHYKLFTGNMGKLIPISCFEVLPGDTVQQATSVLLRVSPLLAPVMHPISVRIHHWFTPYRLLWDKWEDFITGGPTGTGAGVAFPFIRFGANGKATLADYMGIPLGTFSPNLDVSALPFRAYARIYNEYYRDQDLIPAITETVSGGQDSTTPVNTAATRYVSWEKDYITSCRPWPQKGPDITLPLGTSAPIRATAAGQTLGVLEASGSNLKALQSDAQYLTQSSSAATQSLYTDLTAATAVDVNDVRRAFALQRYQEARAQYGSRYTEYLRYLGVRSSDARLQRPEYLGGGKQTISFSEILQTGPDAADDGVGTLRGHGIAALRSRKYRRFFEEHGVVISLLSVRPRAMYSNGASRMWFRTSKEDFWQKELEQIGQQEVYNKEVYAAGASPGATFGYQDRYAEYRHIQSSIAGDFRDTLNFWHLARIFASAPALNQAFVECDPSKRINADPSSDNLWCMASHSIQARRMVSKSVTSRIM